LSADVYSVGATPGRRFESSPLARTAAVMASTISGFVRDLRARLIQTAGEPREKEHDA
jgi:hypothetical protein